MNANDRAVMRRFGQVAMADFYGAEAQKTKMREVLKAHGFKQGEPEPEETERWMFSTMPDLLVCTFSYLPWANEGAGQSNCALCWFRDADNFSMCPFDMHGDNTDMVRPQHFEKMVLEHIAYVRK